MSEELKPCPCGGQVYVGELRFTGETQWSVGCLHCDRAVRRSDKSEAIAAWNRRAPMTAPTPAGEEGDLRVAAEAILAAEGKRGTGAFFEAVENHALTLARALLSSPDARREALETIIYKYVDPSDVHPDDANVVREIAERFATHTQEKDA